MSKKKTCCNCSKSLTKDETALAKKLIGAETDEFYCLECMAEYFGCTVNDLKEKIAEFKEQGCILFL